MKAQINFGVDTIDVLATGSTAAAERHLQFIHRNESIEFVLFADWLVEKVAINVKGISLYLEEKKTHRWWSEKGRLAIRIQNIQR